MTPSAGIYVHLPFCPYICPYCDFAKWAWDDAKAARYLDALHAELAAAPQVAARTLFFEPDGPGFVRLTVTDATGAADSVVVRLQ